LISLENTANRGGGSCYDFNEMKSIKEVAEKNGLTFHLDGARLFNALVAKNETPKQYGELFHTISICLSKGLGAPIGSLLLGPKDFIKKARRVRKVFGGGMRQAGSIAAAGLFALKNNIERLAEDHVHAKMIADILASKDFIGEILPVETNIIIVEVKGKYSAPQLAEKFKEESIRVIAISPTHIRIVVHLDISPDMVQKTIDAIHKF